MILKNMEKKLQEMGAREMCLYQEAKDGAALLDENGNIHTMGNVPGKLNRSSVGCGGFNGGRIPCRILQDK